MFLSAILFDKRFDFKLSVFFAQNCFFSYTGIPVGALICRIYWIQTDYAAGARFPVLIIISKIMTIGCNFIYKAFQKKKKLIVFKIFTDITKKIFYII